jgi:flagellar export protein FliJ
MKQFRFRLQRVLDWQRERCDWIENTIRQVRAELENKQSRLAAIEAALVAAQEHVLTATDLRGSSLTDLASYRLRVQRLQTKLAVERQECEARLKKHQADWLEARRRYRIMEKLKLRKESEHSYLSDRELDHLAAEAYAARWHNENAYSRSASR